MNPIPLFIFSLPRSGSTLMQRILSAHKDITTASESHILLPYLFTIKEEGVYSKYNHQFTVKGINAFCQEMPNGIDDYLEEIRSFALRLYAKATHNNEKYFVDKAGAYHLIVEDIINLFPESKFIFLWRNPLSIISSLMESWTDGKWYLYEHYIRLFEGPCQLVKAYQKYRNKAYSIRYEDIITNPEEEIRRLFIYLDLPFDPDVMTRFVNIRPKGGLADQPGMNRYKHLSKEPLEKWKGILSNPIRKAWCRRYLRQIGNRRLKVMGYNLAELIDELDAIPLSTHYILSDIWRIPYGVLFRLLEGQIVKNKLKAILNKGLLYSHS